MVQQIIPVLYTQKILETIKFYEDQLGFACLTDSPESWAILELDGLQLMVTLPNEHIKFDGPKFTGSFYFKVSDAESIWNQIHEKVQICYPLERFDYGMIEFAFYDNNGYLIQIGEEAKTEEE